jgi:hypothetical protein
MDHASRIEGASALMERFAAVVGLGDDSDDSDYVPGHQESPTPDHRRSPSSQSGGGARPRDTCAAVQQCTSGHGGRRTRGRRRIDDGDACGVGPERVRWSESASTSEGDGSAEGSRMSESGVEDCATLGSGEEESADDSEDESSSEEDGSETETLSEKDRQQEGPVGVRR